MATYSVGQASVAWRRLLRLVSAAIVIVVALMGATPALAMTISGLTQDYGPADGSIIVGINGDEIPDDLVVKFDGVEAEIIASTPTGPGYIADVQVLVPPHNFGTVDVTFTAGGQTVTLSNGFTYSSFSFEGVYFDYGPVSGGMDVVLLGGNFDGLTGIYVDHNPVSIPFVVQADQTVVATMPAHAAGFVDITLKSATEEFTRYNAFQYEEFGLSRLEPSRVPLSGGLITIHGDGFTPSSTVTIGGQPVVATYFSSHILKATAPAAATAGSGISVSVETGAWERGLALQYVPPIVTAIAPTEGSSAGGTDVTITGVGFSPGSVVRFDGVAAQTTYESFTTLHAKAPAHGAGDVLLTVTDNGVTAAADELFTFRTPTVTGFSPSHGSVGGGTEVTITGTSFTQDAVVKIGGKAATITHNDGSSITVTTPVHATGSASVEVILGGQTLTASGSFTFDPPTITSVSPDSFTGAGNVTVTVTGTGFNAGVDYVAIGDDQYTNLTIVSDTKLTFQTRETYPGEGWLVSARTPSGVLTTSITVWYMPEIYSVTPSEAMSGAQVTMHGYNLNEAGYITFGGNPATIIATPDDNTVIVQVPTHAPGVVDITFSTWNLASPTATKRSAFTYLAPLSVDTVTPSHGSPSGKNTITLTGAGFTADTTVSIAGISVTPTLKSSTVLEVTAPPHSPAASDPAAVQIVVTRGSETVSKTYTYDKGTVTGIIPDHITYGVETIVTIKGTGLETARYATSDFGQSFELTAIDDQTATMRLPANFGSPDSYGFTVDFAGRLAATTAYSVPAGSITTLPAIASLDTTKGGVTGGNTVTIRGAYISRATSFTFGGIPATDLTVVNSDTITVKAPAHAAGEVTVAATFSGYTITSPVKYTYGDAVSLDSIAPPSGTPSGNTELTLTGAGFTASTTVTIDGETVTPTLVDSNTLTVRTPAHAPAEVAVTVSNDFISASKAYTYNSPAFISMTPDHVSVGDETDVTINGTGIGTAGYIVPNEITQDTNLTVQDDNTIIWHSPGKTLLPQDVQTLVLYLTYPAYNEPRLDLARFTILPIIDSLDTATGSAVGGNKVSIHGTSISLADSVSFGGISATDLVVQDPDTILVTVPAHAAGEVTVTATVFGYTITSPIKYRYVDALSVTQIDPPSVRPTGNEEVVLTGTGFTPDTKVYLHDAPVPVTFVSSTELKIKTIPYPPNSDAALVLENESENTSTTLHIDDVTIDTDVSSLAFFSGNTITLAGRGIGIVERILVDGLLPIGIVDVKDADTITVLLASMPPGEHSLVLASNTLDWSLNLGEVTYLPTVDTLSPVTGTSRGGTRVTLQGDQLAGNVSTVTFDGIAGTDLTTVNSNTITVLTPPHSAGVVPVAIRALGSTVPVATSFTYLPLTISSAMPSAGSSLGGTPVTVTGGPFTGDTTVEIGGTTVTPTSITGTEIQFVTPPHAIGSAQIIVKDGEETASIDFSYVEPLVVTSISPNSRAPNQSLSATINGSGFTSDTIVTINGESQYVIERSSTALTVYIDAHAAGSYDVVVTRGGDTARTSLTWIDDLKVFSWSPTSAPPSGGTEITFTGQGFTSGTTVKFGEVEVPVTFVDPSTIKVTPPEHPLGSVSLFVQTDFGLVARTFLYLDQDFEVTALQPNQGPESGHTHVDIKGSGFFHYSTIVLTPALGGDPIEITPQFVDENTLRFTTPAAVGNYNVSVRRADGSIAGPLPFTYYAVSFSSVTPNRGKGTDGDTITLNGSGLGDLSDVYLTPRGGDTSLRYQARHLVAQGDTALSFDLPALPPGTYDVNVAFVSGEAMHTELTYAVKELSFTAVEPANGTMSGNTQLTLTGVGFTSNTTVAIDNIDVTPDVVDSNTLRVLTPPHMPGPVTVAITEDGDTYTQTFTYDVPTITQISPASTSYGQPSTITINGTGLATAASFSLGDGQRVPVSVLTDDTLEVTLPGSYANPDTYTPSLHFQVGDATYDMSGGSFTILPTIDTVSPKKGSKDGNETVTITGKSISRADTVSFGGVAATIVSRTDDSITVQTPPHATGKVVIAATVGEYTVTSRINYSYYGAVTFASLEPTNGTPTGGTELTLTGAGFTPNTTVTIGDVAVTPVFVDSTTLRVTTPPHKPDYITVTVSESGDTDTQVYTYNMPTVTAMTPNEVPLGPAADVIITGTGLGTARGMSLDDGEDPVTIIDDNTVKWHMAERQLGPNPYSLALAFGTVADSYYVPIPGKFTVKLPDIQFVSPNRGLRTGGETVTIKGPYVSLLDSVSFGAVEGTDLTTIDMDTITVRTPAAATQGQARVAAKLSNYAIATNITFLYINPLEVTVSPAHGTRTGGTRLTITTDSIFSGNTSVKVDGMSVAHSFSGRQTMYVTTPPHASGTVDITVTDGSYSHSQQYTYDDPAITGVTPSSGSADGGYTVSITGSGFAAPATVSIAGTAVQATVASDTEITFTAPAHAAGVVDLVVKTGGGDTLPEVTLAAASSFTYTATPATISAISPTHGDINGETVVTITGTGFTDRSSVSFDGLAARVEFVSATELRAIAPAHAEGPVDVAVSTDGTVVTAGVKFTYAPIASSSSEPPQSSSSAPPSSSEAPSSSSVEPSSSEPLSSSEAPSSSSPSSSEAPSSSSEPSSSELPPSSSSAPPSSSETPSSSSQVSPSSELSSSLDISSVSAQTTAIVESATAGRLSQTGSVDPVIDNAVQAFFTLAQTANDNEQDLSAIGRLAQGYVGLDKGKVSTSLSAIDAAVGRQKPRDWDAFIDASFGALSVQGASGRFATAHAGLGYRVNPSTMAGVVVTLDSQHMSSGTAVNDSAGVMLTPFVGGRLSESVFYDAYAGFGLDQVTVSNGAGGSGTYGAQRWTAGGTLSGQFTMGDFTFSPALTANYAEVTSDAFIDSNGLSFDAETIGKGSLSFAPELRYTIRDPDGISISPSIGASLGLGIDTRNGVVKSSGLTDSLTLGLDLTTSANATIRMRLGADGLVYGDVKSIKANVGVHGTLH